MKNNPPVLVVTDLDGSLLDHNTYSFTAAKPALTILKHANIPLIINSSKTASEIKELRTQLDNHDPFIIENGSGIYLTNNERIDFGIKRQDILNYLHMLRQEHEFKFTGFNDLNNNELAVLTGLSEKEAERAKQRDFTEPLLWQDSEEQYITFCSLLVQKNLSAVKGGRFISVSGKIDKGKAVAWIRDFYGKQYELAPKVVALGDSENDIPMLKQADYPVLIRSPAHGLPTIDIKDVIITKETGPLGWNNSLIELLKKLNIG